MTEYDRVPIRETRLTPIGHPRGEKVEAQSAFLVGTFCCSAEKKLSQKPITIYQKLFSDQILIKIKFFLSGLCVLYVN